MAAGDFNGDGWLDAASANYYGNNVSVLINDQIWPPPDAPSVSINDVTVTEGNTGTTQRDFTLTLSAAYGAADHGPLRDGGRQRHRRQRLHGRVGRRDLRRGPDQLDHHGCGPRRPPAGSDRELRRQPQRPTNAYHRRRPGGRHHPRRRTEDHHQRRDGHGRQHRQRERDLHA